MLDLELLLIKVIDEYGYRGKYDNLFLNSNSLKPILEKLGSIDCSLKTIRVGKRIYTYRLTYSDGSRIWVSVSGGLSWRFNFVPQTLLGMEVNGRIDPSQVYYD